MDEFTINSRITRSDYSKYMYTELYKKPQFILATLLGLYLIVTVILNYFGVINFYSETPYIETLAALFILFGPTIIVLITSKGYISNPSMRHDIIYTFKNDGVSLQGHTFNSEFTWAHIIKIKETKKFLLLYSSKKLANFIDKSKLNLEQLQFIKSRIGRK
jgi:hypothetical protein